MIQIVVDIALALFFIGVGFMLSDITPQVLGGWFMVAGLVVGLGALIWQISRTIWIPRNKWFAWTSYKQIKFENDPMLAINKDQRRYWRSSEPQAEGEDFKIDMAKARSIKSIEFLPDYSWVEVPKQWRMMFYGEGNKTLGHKDGFYDIRAESPDIPNNTRYIQVIIKEPHEDMDKNTNYAKRHGTKVFWTISSIEIKEYVFNIKGKKFWGINV